MPEYRSEGVFTTLLRVRRFKEVIPYLTGRVLDYGCGVGLLARHVPAARYLGVEPDRAVLEKARALSPMHRFLSSVDDGEHFETVVLLAVLEHVREPASFVGRLAGYLNDSAEAHLVITTPHPAYQSAYVVGARIGLFARSASEEHVGLLDRATVEKAGNVVGLSLVNYRRFLLGANQLFVFEKSPQHKRNALAGGRGVSH